MDSMYAGATATKAETVSSNDSVVLLGKALGKVTVSSEELDKTVSVDSQVPAAVPEAPTDHWDHLGAKPMILPRSVFTLGEWIAGGRGRPGGKLLDRPHPPGAGKLSISNIFSTHEEPVYSLDPEHAGPSPELPLPLPVLPGNPTSPVVRPPRRTPAIINLTPCPKNSPLTQSPLELLLSSTFQKLQFHSPTPSSPGSGQNLQGPILLVFLISSLTAESQS